MFLGIIPINKEANIPLYIAKDLSNYQVGLYFYLSFVERWGLNVKVEP